ncbi:uncharacterized protein LOC116766879 [Danaus plexippus]|uniref:uncharacterized protein LOC116766879 n=1 Tax=Danaus plexippus TaxID=13037 RepID=UPI002AB1910A|nr:uncharacterized protein LOC116766879 [Danaus plexippus]
MGWWINKFTRPSNSCSCGALCYHMEDDENDIFYQSSNIIFTFNHIIYDVDDIYSLTCCGVNIFNVDMTAEDESFLKNVTDVITESENLPRMFPSTYYRPTGLSVTMDINKSVQINERVDIILLKKVKTVDELLSFKKQNPNYNNKTIVVWLTRWTIEEISIVKFSDGVVLDLFDDNPSWDEFCNCPLDFCKENRKPVFYVKKYIIKEYYQLSNRERLINVMADGIVKNRLDGIIVVDDNSDKKLPKEMISSLIRALDNSEKNIDVSKEYFEKSFKTKIPLLAPLSTAFAASLAALTSGARVILVLSVTGVSSQLISFTSPPCHIICIISRKSMARRLHMYRKVIPLFCKTNRSTNWHQKCWSRIHFGTTFALKIGLLELGAKLVVVQPSEEANGYCDSLRILSIPLLCDK